MDHDCQDGACLLCMVTDLYKQIEDLKRMNCLLAQDNLHLKDDIETLVKEKGINS